MDDMSRSSSQSNAASFSRRRFLGAFLTLAAFLRLTRRSAATQLNGDETVIVGGWLLKRSDLR